MNVIPSAPRNKARALAPGVWLATLLITTVSCASSDRQYAVPVDLCGVKVTASALESVLPPGSKASQHPTAVGSNKRCRLHVDDGPVLSVSIEPWERDASAQDVARVALEVDPADTQSEDGRFIYSSKGAVGRVDCPGATASHRSLWATVRVTHEDATEAQMRALITTYANGVPASGACGDMTE
ncbi:hypothetical protein ACFT5C_24705 [Streptomyces sp. NPDC057116]|uniref:hypothetical protein n=1 Tax=Streptomyces sp. NPDC057116 TaxID=3346023 RepID=UPI003635DC2A